MHVPRLAAPGIVLAAYVGALTCAPPASPPAVIPVRDEPRTAPQPSTSASAVPSASAAAPASALPIASAAPSGAAPALPVRSSTPGKIQCGREDCNLATELCCGTSDSGYCDSRTKPNPMCITSDQRLCDESADCPQGQHCCRLFVAGDDCLAFEKLQCTTKKCGRTTEVSNEVCLAGSSCANGPCVVAPGQREGSCPLEAAPLVCGASKCKPGEACCWDPAKRAGTCMTGSCPTIGDSSHRFECLRPSDCGPGLDCYNGSGTTFFSDYGCGRLRCSSTILVAGPVLCESVADCPWLPRAQPNGDIVGITPRSCLPDKDLPPGVKACRYR